MIHHLFERKTSKGALAGMGALGAAIGSAITYYLYATKEGAKKRAKISRFVQDMKDDAEIQVEKVKERFADKKADM